MTDIAGVADGQYTAVVDSVEDGFATVFFERDGEEVGNAILDSSVLPVDARQADAVLSVTIAEGEIVDATYEPERTADRANRAQDRFDRLSQRPPSADDDEST